MDLPTSEISHALVTSSQASEYRKNEGIRILPPSNVFICLILAILGHAFWNGTSVGVDLVGRSLGLGSDGVIVLSLAWVAVLITGLLIIARAIFKGIRSLPHD